VYWEKNYNAFDRKWKQCPATTSEKPVFKWLQNLEGDIREAAAARKKDDANEAVVDTVSSRIINHRALPRK
jgi:hypothetical protein